MRGLDAVLAAYADASRLRASERTVKDNISALLHFMNLAGISQVEKITGPVVEHYLSLEQQSGRLPKTISNRLQTIRTFCRWCCRNGVLDTDPTSRIPNPKVERNMPNYLTREELAQTMKVAREHGIYCEVALAAYGGLRLSEMRRLLWSDVDLACKVLIVRKSKSGKPRQVGLCHVAIEALTDHKAKTGQYSYVFPGACEHQDPEHSGGWSPNRPRRTNTWIRLIKPIQLAVPAFRRLPKGCCGRGWHLLRHTYASRLVQEGVSIFKVARWLGHASVTTTERFYAQLAPGYDADCEKI